MSIAEKLSTIAENEQKVYEAGAKSEYDKFWDTYQQNGQRVDYVNAFAEGNSGTRWVYGLTYKPKYPIKPTNAQTMYYATKLPYEVVKDVDFSNCKDFYNAFAYSTTDRWGVVDMRKATRTTVAFDNSRAVIIDKLIVSETTPYSRTFDNCSRLEEVRCEGVIGQSVDFSSAKKLTHNSLMSIIEHLGIVSATKTLTLGTTNLAKLTDAEKAIALEKGWSLA